MELCPEECKCYNSLFEVRSKTKTVESELGVELLAARPINANEIVAVFGNGLVITEESQVRRINNLIASYEGPVGTGFQYSVIRQVPGASTDAIVMPEADRLLALTLTNGESNAEKKACKLILARSNVQIREHGLGQFSNHTCCETHLNAELWLVAEVRKDEDVLDKNGAAFAILRASKNINQDQTISTEYRHTRSGNSTAVLAREAATLAKMFVCRCCQCSGRCVTPAPGSKEVTASLGENGERVLDPAEGKEAKTFLGADVRPNRKRSSSALDDTGSKKRQTRRGGPEQTREGKGRAKKKPATKTNSLLP